MGHPILEVVRTSAFQEKQCQVCAENTIFQALLVIVDNVVADVPHLMTVGELNVLFF